MAEETPLIGLITRYHPVKDHANCLTVVEFTDGTGPYYSLSAAWPNVDVSNKEMSKAIKIKAIKILGLQRRVHLLGEQRDIPHLNAALHIASIASWGEAFPNVSGKAMACGVPCVVADVGNSH